MRFTNFVSALLASAALLVTSTAALPESNAALLGEMPLPENAILVRDEFFGSGELEKRKPKCVRSPLRCFVFVGWLFRDIDE